MVVVPNLLDRNRPGWGWGSEDGRRDFAAALGYGPAKATLFLYYTSVEIGLAI